MACKWGGSLFLKLGDDVFYYFDWVRFAWAFIGVDTNASDHGLEM